MIKMYKSLKGRISTTNIIDVFTDEIIIQRGNIYTDYELARVFECGFDKEFVINNSIG